MRTACGVGGLRSGMPARTVRLHRRHFAHHAPRIRSDAAGLCGAFRAAGSRPSGRPPASASCQRFGSCLCESARTSRASRGWVSRAAPVPPACCGRGSFVSRLVRVTAKHQQTSGRRAGLTQREMGQHHCPNRWRRCQNSDTGHKRLPALHGQKVSSCRFEHATNGAVRAVCRRKSAPIAPMPLTWRRRLRPRADQETVSDEFRQRQHRRRERARPRGDRPGQRRRAAGLRQRRDHDAASRPRSRRSSRREVAVFPVTTGTAANALALAAAVPPCGLRVCHREAHVIDDECGAPEFFMHGAKLAGLPASAASSPPRTVARYLAGLLADREADAAEGAVDLAGDRMRHGLTPRRDRGPLRGVPGAGPRPAHGRRALRQRPRRLGCTPAEMTWKRASTSSPSAPPRTAA